MLDVTNRYAGILLPVFSLPGPYGAGTFGKSAYDFADFLADAGQSLWQILPLNPAGGGNSPYSVYSSFAGNPLFIDPALLAEDGLLTEGELSDFAALPCCRQRGKINYVNLVPAKSALLEKAAERGLAKKEEAFEAFRKAEASWLSGYALYMACREYYNGAAWLDWPEDIRLRKPEALENHADALADRIAVTEYIQYLFFKQWKALKEYANGKGVLIIGDMPVYVSLDSADVWSEPSMFELDEKNCPKETAGVPPDYFSEEGQLWGNPLYDWEKMKTDGYGWWIRRVDAAFRLYDVLRIDHFRGLASYWAVKSGAESAKEGRWRPGPGMDLVSVLTGWFYDRQFIAEDLGILTPDVYELLEKSGLPGMKVLEFAFDPASESSYLPHRYGKNCVCYVGTHDNTTARDWFEHAEDAERRKAVAYLGLNEEEGIAAGLIRGGMASAAFIFVAQMADWLCLGAEGRINVPGVPEGNWAWRMEGDVLTPSLAEKIRYMTEITGRSRR